MNLRFFMNPSLPLSPDTNFIIFYQFCMTLLIVRPIANRVGTLPLPFFPPSLFLPSPFGFPPYPRMLLPQPATLPSQLPPSSPPPLAPNRPFSPRYFIFFCCLWGLLSRMRKLSPHRGNSITDGNSPTGRMTRYIIEIVHCLNVFSSVCMAIHRFVFR